MKYAYRCEHGHETEVSFPAGSAPAEIVCVATRLGVDAALPPHDATRDYEAEFASQSVFSDDPFRRSYLSSAIDHNLAEQGRPLDEFAPRDKFDLKRIEANTGRVYIGDNIAGMSPKAQKAILNGPKPRRANRPHIG